MYRFSTSRARQEAVFVIHNRLLTRAARYMRLPCCSIIILASGERNDLPWRRFNGHNLF